VTGDEQVIRGILQQIETAWNNYDSLSLAALFAEDANFIQSPALVKRCKCSKVAF
jgi:hypothetical protein